MGKPFSTQPNRTKIKIYSNKAFLMNVFCFDLIVRRQRFPRHSVESRTRFDFVWQSENILRERKKADRNDRNELNKRQTEPSISSIFTGHRWFHASGSARLSYSLDENSREHKIPHIANTTRARLVHVYRGLFEMMIAIEREKLTEGEGEGREWEREELGGEKKRERESRARTQGRNGRKGEGERKGERAHLSNVESCCSWTIVWPKPMWPIHINENLFVAKPVPEVMEMKRFHSFKRPNRRNFIWRRWERSFSGENRAKNSGNFSPCTGWCCVWFRMFRSHWSNRNAGNSEWLAVNHTVTVEIDLS